LADLDFTTTVISSPVTIRVDAMRRENGQQATEYEE